METTEAAKEITLDEVVVKGTKPTAKSGLLSQIGDFFSGLFSKKTSSDSEPDNQTTTKQNKSMAAGAIVTSVTQAAGAIFGFLVKGKELKIEEENTKQLQLQLEATEDIELQKTLQAKLAVQMTQLNATAESDRLRRIGGWVTLLMVTSLIGLVVVQVFRYKREKDKPQAPIYVR